MIRIRAFGPEGRGGFYVSGHAGYDDPGKDIICAGVSALTQGAAIGLGKQHIAFVFSRDDQKGIFALFLREEDEQKRSLGQAVLAATYFALCDIAAQYPEFLTITLY